MTMFIDHQTYVTATEAEQMSKAATIVTGLGVHAHGLMPSLSNVCVWLVHGWDRHNDKVRDIVVNTVTREARDATDDEILNGVDAI